MTRELFAVWEFSRCLFLKKMQCHYTHKVMGNNAKVFTEYSKWSNEGKWLSLCICHAKWALYTADCKPVLQLKLHVLYCQMWVQIWLGMLDGWNTKIKVYAACFLLWRVLESWSNFSTYCESDFFNGADMLQWGWKLEGSRMQQIVIGIKPVPGNLLKFTQHKCKLSMKNSCGSNISSWHKNILKVLWNMWRLQGSELQSYWGNFFWCLI